MSSTHTTSKADTSSNTHALSQNDAGTRRRDTTVAASSSAGTAATQKDTSKKSWLRRAGSSTLKTAKSAFINDGGWESGGRGNA